MRLRSLTKHVRDQNWFAVAFRYQQFIDLNQGNNY